MKKVIINNNLHEDDFGEVIRNITSIDNMFVINYTTEKGFDKCTQAIALTQKAVNDVKQIAKAKLICGPMEAVDFHK
uniref:D-lactate dehydrogenase n=1 Tax=Rhabditophanes sp. KR3021 TaxID=114890 RepID=A0AC35TLR6_9BILA